MSSGSCVFCPNEMWTELSVKDPSETPPRQTHAVPVCIDCLDAFKEHKNE